MTYMRYKDLYRLLDSPFMSDVVRRSQTALGHQRHKPGLDVGLQKYGGGGSEMYVQGQEDFRMNMRVPTVELLVCSNGQFSWMCRGT